MGVLTVVYIVAAFCSIIAFFVTVILGGSRRKRETKPSAYIRQGPIIRIARSATKQSIASSGRVPLEITPRMSKGLYHSVSFYIRTTIAALFLRPSSRKPAFLVEQAKIQLSSSSDGNTIGSNLGGLKVGVKLFEFEDLDHFYRSIKPSALGRLYLGRKRLVAIADSSIFTKPEQRATTLEVDIRRRCIGSDGTSVVVLMSSRTSSGPKTQVNIVSLDEVSPSAFWLIKSRTSDKSTLDISDLNPIRPGLAIRLCGFIRQTLGFLGSVISTLRRIIREMRYIGRRLKRVWQKIRQLKELAKWIRSCVSSWCRKITSTIYRAWQVVKGTYFILFGSQVKLEANYDIPDAERNDDIELYTFRRAITAYLLVNSFICLGLVTFTEDIGLFEVSISNGYFSAAWMFWATCLFLFSVIHLGRKFLYERKREDWNGGTTRCIRDGDLLRDGR